MLQCGLRIFGKILELRTAESSGTVTLFWLHRDPHRLCVASGGGGCKISSR
jgi:hypothetical protein